jgi:hypothetical protein
MRVARSISLLSFLLVVMLLALGLAALRLSQRAELAEREARALRDQAGALSVGDRGRVHAIALDSKDPRTWQWRLYVPKGNRYAWRIAAGAISRDSVPARSVAGISGEPYWKSDNEVLVTANLRREPDGTWMFSVRSKIGGGMSQMGGAELTVPAEELSWLEGAGCTDGRLLGDRGTADLDPRGPIILLQRRLCEQGPDGNSHPAEGLAPGLILWLEK